MLIPVSCDHLSLFGVKQVLKTIRDVERHLGHSVTIAGVLPTFYDARIRLAREAVETLRGHFRERVFEPIRRSTRLAEAPATVRASSSTTPTRRGRRLSQGGRAHPDRDVALRAGRPSFAPSMPSKSGPSHFAAVEIKPPPTANRDA